MARYLVTGGAGFIGTNLVQELVRRKQSVVVLDNLSTGKLSHLRAVRGKIRFIRGDIRRLATVQEVCRGVDFVLHQAAVRSVARSVDHPGETNDTNITGTLNLLLAARDAKVKRVVFASSSSVYGNVGKARNTETLPPAPESPYAVSKLTGEHYCRIFSTLFGLHTVSLRYFNVFGPYQDPESEYSAVIPIFVSRLLHGQPPEVHGDGKQSRDFTHVTNVVRANLLAATKAKLPLGEVFNIGNGETTSILELLSSLQRLLATNIRPRHAARRAGDVFRTQADIAKARRVLGYRPAVSFAEGLSRSVEWYRAEGTSS